MSERDLMRNMAVQLSPEQNFKGKIRFIKSFAGEIFTLGSRADMARVQTGKSNFSSLPPCRRFALGIQSQSLLFKDIKNNETFNPVAYSPFRWCGIHSNVVSICGSYSIPGFLPERKDEEFFLFFLNLKFADDIYVVEMATLDYPLRRKSDFDNFQEKYQELARSLIPINNYSDIYKSPTILIQRPLMFDEVRYIKSIRSYIPS